MRSRASVLMLAVLGCAGLRALPTSLPAPASVRPALGRTLGAHQYQNRGSGWYSSCETHPDKLCVSVHVDSIGHVQSMHWYHSGLRFPFDSISAALAKRFGNGRRGFDPTGGVAFVWTDGVKQMCLRDQLGIERATRIDLELRSLAQLGAGSPYACDEISY